MEDENKTLMDIMSTLSSVVAKVDLLTDKMNNLEILVANDAKQDMRLTSIEASLSHGSTKFERYDARLEKLENAEGERAKATMSTVIKYLLTALVGAIVASGGTILQTLFVRG